MVSNTPNLDNVIFDSNAQRYRVNGRFISQDTINQAVEQRIETSFNRLQNYLKAALDESTPYTLTDYRNAFAQEIKALHITMTVIGGGGRDQITNRQWGTVGANLKKEYKALNGFVKDIEDGKLSEKQIYARSGMYANAVWKSFWASRTIKAESKFTQERRVLRPAEHCVDCIDFANRGWQPIGSLPNPGEQSRCLSNCRCIKEYR